MPKFVSETEACNNFFAAVFISEPEIARTVPAEWKSSDIGDVLGTLSPREELVLRLYYGLTFSTSHTLAEIAAIFLKPTGRQYSRACIWLIKQKALRKCRHPKRSNILKGLEPRIPIVHVEPEPSMMIFGTGENAATINLKTGDMECPNMTIRLDKEGRKAHY